MRRTVLRSDYDPDINQWRKDNASSKQKAHNVAAFDFETANGDAFMTSMSWWDKDKKEYVGAGFDHREEPFTLDWFVKTCWKNMGKLHSQTAKSKKGKKYRVHRMAMPNIYAWNLKFEQGSMLKGWPVATVQYIHNNAGAVVNLKTGEINHDIYKEKGMWTTDSGERIPRNTYVSVFYIPKKVLKIEPIFYRANMGDKKNIRFATIKCYDIMQFFGCSLDKAAKDNLNDSKVSGISRERMGRGDWDYINDNWDEIWEYGIYDSVLTAKLAWIKVQEYENNGVRMNKPLSLASVAEQAVYDLCDMPTINTLAKKMPTQVKQAWTAYQGGWFEATGAGFVEDVQAFDLASAYPHVMWWLPDMTGAKWRNSADYKGDPKDTLFRYLDKKHKMYGICFAECVVRFPNGLPIYPAAKRRRVDGTETACVINPQLLQGWFTGDEIVEFRKWGATIRVLEWFHAQVKADHPEENRDVEDGIRYPLRPFLQTFYSMKLDESAKRDACSDCCEGNPCEQETCEFDKARYNVSKVMINSVYGKLMAMVERNGMLAKTGNLWNSFYASTITGGCRMRLAEFIRINGYDCVRSCATDGIIVKGENIVVPDNPMPVFFTNEDGERYRVNLGDWENDGYGNLLLLMSGVYSIIKPMKADGSQPVKSTYRGNYALFIDKRPDGYFPKDWEAFCHRYADDAEVVRTEDSQPHMRPYSIGEALVRGDLSLVNDFRVVGQKVRAFGDSGKRSWAGNTPPATFGNLLENWHESDPHRRMV